LREGSNGNGERKNNTLGFDCDTLFYHLQELIQISWQVSGHSLLTVLALIAVTRAMVSTMLLACAALLTTFMLVSAA
jgi:hypothetical protein